MASSGFSVMVVGAASELGRELVEVLVERAFPVSEWRLYDDAEAIVALGEDLQVGSVDSLESADFGGADLAFLCGSNEQSRAAASAVQRYDTVIIDLTQTFSAEESAALIVPEVNAELVAAAMDQRLVATPLPAATALAVTLGPVEHAVRLRRVAVTCLEPVSSTAGGVEELARQTHDLLGGRDPTPTLWPSRIAFNLIPQVGELVGTGASDREWQIQRQLQRILDLPDLPISVQAVRVPTFYGLGIVVGVETEEPIDTDSALALLRQAPGVHLHEGQREGESYPTLSDAVGSEATHVGRVREDPTVPCGFTFWIAIDGLRKGTTVNAVQIAECVAREAGARA